MVENNAPITGTRDIGGHKIQYKTAKEHATLDRADFMHLFVTELQYQDPMKPMDSQEMASQLAQFNMVDLLNDNNETMKKLLESDRSRTRFTAVGLIGQRVRYQGKELLVEKKGPAPFDLSLDDPCVSCKVTIRDGDGKVIRSWNMGALDPGVHPLDWDGTDEAGNPVEPGVYHVTIEATDNKDNPVKVTTITTGIVSGLQFPKDGLPKLAIEDGPTVSLADIESVGSTPTSGGE